MHQSQAAVGTLELCHSPGCKKLRGLYVSTFAFAPEAISTSTNEAVAREVRAGLTATPKTLSPWLFYDEAGSHLFEEITELAEYYLTPTQPSIFAAHPDEILREAALGHGPARKPTLIQLGARTC